LTHTHTQKLYHFYSMETSRHQNCFWYQHSSERNDCSWTNVNSLSPTLRSLHWLPVSFRIEFIYVLT